MNEKIRNILGWISLMIAMLLLAACGRTAKSTSPITNTNVVPVEQEYDGQLLGMITKIEQKKKKVSFYDINEDIACTLAYTGATSITDQYGKEMSITELSPGLIMDVYYDSAKGRVVKMSDSKEAFCYQGVDSLKINQKLSMMTLASRNYAYDDALVVTDGEELLTVMDVNARDELTVRGVGTFVYSLTVTTGHGYIRFTNYDDFVGGYVSVGGTMENVTEDMLMVAREGSFRLVMENGNLVGTKNITVLRDKEITVDMGEYHVEEDQVGNVSFLISPSDAQLWINGTKVSSSGSHRMNYGRHKIEVTADGYQSFRGVLTVGDGNAQTIEITLAKDTAAETENDDETTASGTPKPTKTPSSASEEDDDWLEDWPDDEDEDDDTSESSDQTHNSSEDEQEEQQTAIDPTDAATSDQTYQVDKNHTLTIKSPQGVSLYLDGDLKGELPQELPKQIGTHTITLYKTGYVTKSYTVEVEDDGEDLVLSFPELVKE